MYFFKGGIMDMIAEAKKEHMVKRKKKRMVIGAYAWKETGVIFRNSKQKEL